MLSGSAMVYGSQKCHLEDVLWGSKTQWWWVTSCRRQKGRPFVGLEPTAFWTPVQIFNHKATATQWHCHNSPPSWSSCMQRGHHNWNTSWVTCTGKGVWRCQWVAWRKQAKMMGNAKIWIQIKGNAVKSDYKCSYWNTWSHLPAIAWGSRV